MPAAKMTYRLSQASRANLDFAIARAEEVFREAGAMATAADRLKQQAGFHLVGTARMGRTGRLRWWTGGDVATTCPICSLPMPACSSPAAR